MRKQRCKQNIPQFFSGPNALVTGQPKKKREGSVKKRNKIGKLCFSHDVGAVLLLVHTLCKPGGTMAKGGLYWMEGAV